MYMCVHPYTYQTHNQGGVVGAEATVKDPLFLEKATDYKVP